MQLATQYSRKFMQSPFNDVSTCANYCSTNTQTTEKRRSMRFAVKLFQAMSKYDNITKDYNNRK